MAAKKASSRKKVSKKKASAKRASASRKKPAARKVSTSKKKASKKKPAKKSAARKKTTTKKKSAKKKTAVKNKTAKKKSAKKKASKKKAVKKKVAKKKAAAKKTSTKKAATKKAAKKKTGAKTATAKKSTADTSAEPAKKVTAAARRSRSGTVARAVSADDGLIFGIEPYQPERDEDYMNEEQLEHFRQILEAWKRELMEEVDRTVHHMQDEASNFPDPNDRATQESEFGLELRTRDRERKLLRKIDQAIARIDDGSYGYCEETGEEIGLKRLEARPVATLCVEAQERRELAEKQYRDRDDQYR
jgi:DnaK suppressor protein